MSDVKTEVLRQLQMRALNRAKRLVTFIEVDAPGLVLGQAMDLLEDTLAAMSIEYGVSRAESMTERAKVRMGLCKEKECYASMDENGKYDTGRCTEHNAEIAALDTEDDN
jgi:hypothetical protein